MPLSKIRTREKKRLERLNVKPKYEIGYLYPDGRVRLADLAVVKPNEVTKYRVVQPNHKIRNKPPSEVR